MQLSRAMPQGFFFRALLVFVGGVFVLWCVSHAPFGFFSWKYHAIFLSNGQVYFGKISYETEHSYFLRDVYYLKLAKPIVTQDDLAAANDTALIKLGNELHGPTNEMEIPRSSVDFVETLRADGGVVKAILAAQ